MVGRPVAAMGEEAGAMVVGAAGAPECAGSELPSQE